jgi:hypothetical protein
MHGQGATGRSDTKRREATWAAVGGYGYFAPGRVAMDEQRVRAMTAAAHQRLLVSPDPTGRHSAWQSSCQFLGDRLQRVSARIRLNLASAAATAALRNSTSG